MTPSLFGGIEGGGTKFVCAIGTGPQDIRSELRFPTTTPDETLRQAAGFFKEQIGQLGPLASIGIASFGPLDPRPGSPTFGHILSTPKPGWTNFDIVGTIRAELKTPIAFDTDVNAAALGEWCWGAAQGLDSFMYLTVGTGIGGGVFANGRLLHGLLHPEMGHIPIPHDLMRDPFEGVCPFHHDCFEGLASGAALEARWGQSGSTLPADHPAWDLEAEYIALALANYVYTVSPERIIIGGGVGQLAHLQQRVRKRTRELINGYIRSSAILENVEKYIVPPGLGNRAGVLGAIALAQQLIWEK